MNTDNNTKNLVKSVILKPEVIERIKGRNDVIPDLAIALNLVRGSINRLLNENEPNGKLTTISAISIICNKLSIESSEATLEAEPCESR